MKTDGSCLVPYYHPGVGWKFGGRKLSEKRAETLCCELGIPYRKPSESDPDIYTRVLDTRIAGSCFIPGYEKVVSRLSFGDALEMVREDNQYDEFAVALRSGGEKTAQLKLSSCVQQLQLTFRTARAPCDGPSKIRPLCGPVPLRTCLFATRRLLKRE